MFVHDPETGTVWANRADKPQIDPKTGKTKPPALKFDPETGLYKGKYTPDLQAAWEESKSRMARGENRGFGARTGQQREWQGQHWITMTLGNANRDPSDIKEAAVHEATHVYFAESGKEGKRESSDGMGAKLDTDTGRKWIDVERNALARALESTDPNEKRAWLADALAAREYRQEVCNSKKGEVAFEQSEGVAMFTGGQFSKLGNNETQIKNLEKPPKLYKENGYQTGHAYATLMEELGPSWRKEDTTKMDLGDKARREHGIDKVTGKDAEKAANKALEHKASYEADKGSYKIPGKEYHKQPVNTPAKPQQPPRPTPSVAAKPPAKPTKTPQAPLPTKPHRTPHRPMGATAPQRPHRPTRPGTPWRTQGAAIHGIPKTPAGADAPQMTHQPARPSDLSPAVQEAIKQAVQEAIRGLVGAHAPQEPLPRRDTDWSSQTQKIGAAMMPNGPGSFSGQMSREPSAKNGPPSGANSAEDRPLPLPTSNGGQLYAFERTNAMVDNIVKSIKTESHDQSFADAAQKLSSALGQAKGQHKPNLRSL